MPNPQTKKPSPTVAKAVARISKIIASEPAQPLDGYYWRVGKEAGSILQKASSAGNNLGAAQLAGMIGLKDATLRQAIKFSERATQSMAAKLQKAGIPWRGVVSWLGVKKKADARALYNEMLGGLTNSTEIRKHIEKNFKKKPLPRISPDLTTACDKARKQAEDLNAILQGLDEVLQRRGASDSASARAGGSKSVRRLARSLQATRGQVNATLAGIRRRG